MTDTTNSTTGTDGATTGAGETLGEGGLSALRAERAENKALKAQLKAAEDAIQAGKDAELSELQKWQKKAESADAKLKTYEAAQALETTRAAVAARPEFKNVPADLITGTDEASMVEFATKLATALGPQKPEPNPFLGQSANGGSASDADAQALSALGFGAQA